MLYSISFKFDESGKWSYKLTEEIDATFHLYDDNSNLQTISQIEPQVWKEALGAFVATKGSNQGNLEALKLKAESWEEQARTGNLCTKDDALITIFSTCYGHL